MTPALDGDLALVTGGFSGLGLAFAGFLAQAGARVAIAGRRIDEGERAAATLRLDGPDVQAFRMDVTDRASIDAALADVNSRMGRVTVLVNNAGVAVTKPFLEQTEADWQRVIDVDLSGAMRVSQAVGLSMKQAGGGRIVHIASILGLRVAAQVSAYAAAKAGLVHLTHAMALELGRHGIRVNAMAPGYIETDLNREFFASEAGQALQKRIPMRRLGRAEELREPLLVLVSRQCSYLTGSVLVVDGGHSINSL